MISEILGLISELLSFPTSIEDKNKRVENNWSLVFTIILIIEIYSLIPKLKYIYQLENYHIILITATCVSVILSFITVAILKSKNILSQLPLQNFILLMLDLILGFIFFLCLIVKFHYIVDDISSPSGFSLKA